MDGGLSSMAVESAEAKSPDATDGKARAAETPEPVTPSPGDVKQDGDDIERKPDALIVAALMGSSIAKFNRLAANKKSNNPRLITQMSAPTPKLDTNATTTTLLTTTTTNDAAATPSGTQAKVNAVLEKFKSLQHHHHDTSGGSVGGVVNQNFQDTKSSNATANSTPTTNKAAHRRTTTKNTLNSSKLAANATNSANSRSTGSKAARCTLSFLSYRSFLDTTVTQFNFFKCF